MVHRDPTPKHTPFESGQLGANAATTSDYSGFAWFTDHVRDSRGFSSRTLPGGVDANLDSNGWPADGDWQNVLSAGGNGQYGIIPVGTVIYGSYETDPGVAYAIEPVGNDCQFYDDVVQPDGITHHFRLVITGYTVIIAGHGNSSAPGCRNLILPSAEYGYTLANYSSSVFLPWLSKYMRQFTGFRLMGLMDPGIWPYVPPWYGQWANVKTKDTKHGHQTPTAAGSSLTLDLLIEMLNEARAYPGSRLQYVWFNIIHNADDDYISNFVTYVKDNLDPNLRPYYELSNETWNYTFPQAAYFFNLSQDNVSAHNLSWDGATNINALRAREYAHRAMQMSQIVSTVYSGVTDKLAPRCILSGQWSSPQYMGTMLDSVEFWTGLPVNRTFYGLAYAPYFGPQNALVTPMPDTPTVDEILAQFYLIIDNNKENGYTTNVTGPTGNVYFKEQSVEYQVKAVCYEGGWDYGNQISNNAVPTMVAALNDPRMVDVVRYYFQELYKCQIDEFNWYASGPSTWYLNSSFNYAITDSLTQVKPPLKAFNDIGNSPFPTQVYAHNYLNPTIGTPFDISAYYTSRKQSYTAAELADFVTTLNEARVLSWDGPYTNGPSDVLNCWVRSAFFNHEQRWLHFTTYVEVAGTYEFTLYGTGGAYTGTGTSKVYDPANDAAFRWELYDREYSDPSGTFTLMGYSDPCLGGNLNTPQPCKTPVSHTLTKGWHTFRLVGNARCDDGLGHTYLYPDVNTYA